VHRTSLDIGALLAAGFETPVAVAPPVAALQTSVAAPPASPATVAVPAVPIVVAQANLPPPAGLNMLGNTSVNGILRGNDALLSTDGRWLTVFQGDGNLVTYDMLGGMKAAWASNTAGQASGGFAAMQGDGNLVVYTADSKAKWSSATSSAGVNRNFTLAMQNDGNLVVYDSQGGEALWGLMNGRITLPEPNGMGETYAQYQQILDAQEAA
jgi:hypothetical protein